MPDHTNIGDTLNAALPPSGMFARIFKRAPLLMTISDAADGRYIDVNDSFTRVTGYTRDEAVGRRSTDIGFIAPADRARLIKQLEEHGRVEDLPLKLRHRDGHDLHVLYWGEIVELEGALRLLSLAVDVTEQRRAEAARRESEARFRLVVDELPQFVSYTTRDLVYEFINKTYLKAFGLQPADVLGKTLPEVIGEAAYEQARPHVERVLRGERVRYRERYEYEHGPPRDIEGTLIPEFDADGGVRGYFAVLSDVTDYVRAQEALHDAVLRQEAAVRAGSVGFWDWDVRTGAVVYSHEWKRQIGYAPDEIEPRFAEWQSRVHPDDLAETLTRINDYIDSNAPSYGVEFRLRHKDGSYRWILSRAAVVARNDVGEPLRVMGSHVDITQRKEAELALRAEQRALADAQRVARLGSWEFDPQTGRSTWSTELFHIFGRDPALGVPAYPALLELVHVDDRARLDAEVQNALTSGNAYELELRALRADGTVIHIVNRGEPQVDEQGRVVRLIGTIQDVTELKRAEHSLAKSLTDLRLAQRIARVGNWSFDPEVGIPEWSDFVYEIYERDRSLGPPTLDECRAIYRDAEFERFHGAFTAAVARGEPYDITLKLELAAEKVKWIRAICEPEAERGPAGHRLRGTIQDITHERVLEQQLRQSQRMEAVGQLAGGVAHDFNNILTAILGYAELAQAATSDPGSAGMVLEALRQIQEGGERAASLTRQLLAFSRKQTSLPAPLDLNGVLFGMEKMLRRLLTENIAFSISPAESLWIVEADRGQLEQVVMNLVINARDAMPDGGRLTITTRNDQSPALPAREASGGGAAEPATLGRCVCLEVRDTGCGMDDATRERIFEPFFSTKEMGHGTGLGLATTYGIIKQAGGEIVVSSRPGAGTTFSIFLPASDATTIPAADVSSRTAALTGTETVLLCEDDPSVRGLAEQLLLEAGYHVFSAPRGAEGLAWLAARERKIDLLVTDVIMPDINGRELARRVTARCGPLPVLYISGYTADVIAHHGVLEDGVAFLEKPFTRERLLERVRELLDGR